MLLSTGGAARRRGETGAAGESDALQARTNPAMPYPSQRHAETRLLRRAHPAAAAGEPNTSSSSSSAWLTDDGGAHCAPTATSIVVTHCGDASAREPAGTHTPGPRPSRAHIPQARALRGGGGATSPHLPRASLRRPAAREPRRLLVELFAAAAVRPRPTSPARAMRADCYSRSSSHFVATLWRESLRAHIPQARADPDVLQLQTQDELPRAGSALAHTCKCPLCRRASSPGRGRPSDDHWSIVSAPRRPPLPSRPSRPACHSCTRLGEDRAARRAGAPRHARLVGDDHCARPRRCSAHQGRRCFGRPPRWWGLAAG